MRGIDYTESSYVRFYRKTASFKLLGRAAQCVYMGLRGELDPAGFFRLDGASPAEALAVELGWMAPEDLGFIEAGLNRLIERGWIVYLEDEDALCDPWFWDAEHARKADRLRQRESRARRSQGVRERLELVRGGVGVPAGARQLPLPTPEARTAPIAEPPRPPAAEPAEREATVTPFRGRPAAVAAGAGGTPLADTEEVAVVAAAAAPRPEIAAAVASAIGPLVERWSLPRSIPAPEASSETLAEPAAETPAETSPEPPPIPAPLVLDEGTRYVAAVRGAWLEAGGRLTPLSRSEIDLARSWQTAGMSVGFVSGLIREVSEREAAKGRSISSLLYFRELVEESWRAVLPIRWAPPAADVVPANDAAAEEIAEDIEDDVDAAAATAAELSADEAERRWQDGAERLRGYIDRLPADLPDRGKLVSRLSDLESLLPDLDAVEAELGLIEERYLDSRKLTQEQWDSVERCRVTLARRLPSAALDGAVKRARCSMLREDYGMPYPSLYLT